jgi:hypothetical protein
VNYKTLLCAIAGASVIQLAGSPRAEAALDAFLVFSAPGAGTAAGQGTVVKSANENEQLTGNFTDSKNHKHGFVATRTGNSLDILSFSWGASNVTEGTAINNSGVVAGEFQDEQGVTHGLVRSADGALTKFDAPGSGVRETVPMSIAEDGTIVGYYKDCNSVYHGFVRSADGAIARIDAPEAGTAKGQGTLAYRINSDGTILGQIYDKNDVAHGWVRHSSCAFSSVTSPRACESPGFGTFVAAQGLSDSGEVVGGYTDKDGTMHGFATNPSNSNEFTYFDVPCAGTGGTYPDAVIEGGMIAGHYYDKKGNEQPFVRMPQTGQIVTSFSTGSSGGEDRLTENVSLAYDRIHVDYATAAGTVVDENSVNKGFDILLLKAD